MYNSFVRRVFIPPRKRSLSVCLNPVCGHDFVLACSRKWVQIFLKICTLATCHLKMCTWYFPIDWIIFLYFTARLFCVLRLVVFFTTRNSALRIMKNFDLNMENVLFLN